MEIKLDPNDLKPIVETVLGEMEQRFRSADERIAFTEVEAADLLGVSATTLRDERLRGRVDASVVGRKIRYTRQNLFDYLASRRWEKK